jgi:hypothetical protein
MGVVIEDSYHAALVEKNEKKSSPGSGTFEAESD